MSKRVANTTSRTARNGRVRLGWRKQRMLSLLEEQEKQARMGNLNDEAMKVFESFKAKVRQMVPTRMFRRTQGR